LPLARALFDLERGNPAAFRPRVFDRRLELCTDRSPERNQHPLRALLILPGAERTPHTSRVKCLGVVADQRCRIQRGAMVFAAKRVTIEQPHAALLARADQKLAVSI